LIDFVVVEFCAVQKMKIWREFVNRIAKLNGKVFFFSNYEELESIDNHLAMVFGENGLCLFFPIFVQSAYLLSDRLDFQLREIETFFTPTRFRSFSLSLTLIDDG
jgi:hypothetical protein